MPDHPANRQSRLRKGDKPYYRWSATRPDYATPSVAGHPPTYSVREERILVAVDDWLATLTDPDHLDATVDAILAADRDTEPEPAEVTRARRQQQRLRTELDRMLAAIRAGMHPVLAPGETRKIQPTSPPPVPSSTVGNAPPNARSRSPKPTCEP